MREFKIKLSEPFTFNELNNSVCPDVPGIYFHFVKGENDLYYIIYVGKSKYLLTRQKQHKRHFEEDEYSLYTFDSNTLDIKYMPGFDKKLPNTRFNELMHQCLKNTFIICGISEGCDDDDYKKLEGAINNYLYKRQKTRKYLFTSSKSYNLPEGKIKFIYPNSIKNKLFGLKDFSIPVDNNKMF